MDVGAITIISLAKSPCNSFYHLVFRLSYKPNDRANIGVFYGKIKVQECAF